MSSKLESKEWLQDEIKKLETSNEKLGQKVNNLVEENAQIKKRMRDISGSKFQKDTLYSDICLSLDMFKQAFDELPVCLLAITPEGKRVYANKTYSRIRNVDLSDPNYSVYDIAFSFKTNEELKNKLTEIRNAGGTYTYTTPFHNYEDNTDGIMQITALRMFNNGKEIFWFFTSDISELVKRRGEVLGLNELLKSIIDSLPFYLYVRDTGDDLKVLFWNKKCAEASGCPAEEIVGKKAMNTNSFQTNFLKLHNYDLEVMHTQKSISKQDAFMDSKGNVNIVQIEKFLVPLENRAPLLVSILFDITDIESIEKELVEARIRTEEADNLKKAFIANMSQEVRSPLSAIIGFADLINNAKSREEAVEYSNIIRQSTEKLLKIFNSILDISELESDLNCIVKTPFNIYSVFEAEYYAQKNNPMLQCRLIFDHVDQLVIANGDAIRLRQVLNNLLTNSIKSTQNGEIHMGYYVLPHKICCYVRDNGTGISAENQKSIFKYFSRLKPEEDGLGLGLPISKIILEKMGGEICVVSKESMGSTFWFSIPAKI